MSQEITELSHTKLTKYAIKAAASRDDAHHMKKLHDEPHEEPIKKHFSKKHANRTIGIKKATDRIASKPLVGVHETTLMSYEDYKQLDEYNAELDFTHKLTVNKRLTKSPGVVQRHSQRERAMYHTNRTSSVINTSFKKRNNRDPHLTDRDGHQLTDRVGTENRRRVSKVKNIGESAYLENRKAIHDAHAEAGRSLASKERDPELKRLDRHRAKKHEHASRVLDKLLERAAARKKK